MSSDISSSLLALENEISDTVQALRDDLKENQDLYDCIDDIPPLPLPSAATT